MVGIRKDPKIELVSAQEEVPATTVSESDFGDPILFEDPEPQESPQLDLDEPVEEMETPAATVAETPGANVFDNVGQKQAVRYDRLRTEVLNSVFRAEKLRDTNPDGSLEILDRSVANVEASKLADEAKQTLLGYLKRSQEAVKAYAEERKPIIELEQRNAAVKEAIRAEMKTKIRIEQDFAQLVEKFNDLIEQRRYAEAEVVAKKANELNPELAEGIVMVEKAKFARQIEFNRRLKQDKERGFLDVMNGVELSAIPQDEEITYPNARDWKDLTARRKKFGRADGRLPSEKELEIEKALKSPISLSFMERPLTEVIQPVSYTHLTLPTKA